MPRFLATLLVVALLGGTATAFAVTERLKLVPTPIIAPQLTEAFSPVCECPTERARIVAVVEELGGYVKDLAGDGVLAFLSLIHI